MKILLLLISLASIGCNGMWLHAKCNTRNMHVAEVWIPPYMVQHRLDNILYQHEIPGHYEKRWVCDERIPQS